MNDFKLNREQEAAVNSKAKHILCLAGAGTGKTYTMIAKIAKLVKSGEDPESILALTFTNAASNEMNERYKKLEGVPHNKTPEFRTFHAFCYSLLCSDQSVRNKLGYSKIPDIATEANMKQICRRVKLRLGCKLTDSEIANGDKLTGNKQFMYTAYQKALIRELDSANVITFDMLCTNVCKLFTDDDWTIAKYKNKYKYIFVDEFQDTDPIQYKFVSSFTTASIFCVGDALQALYSFRGADSSIIKSLADDPKWTKIRLVQNYRSTKQIVNFANAMSTYADDNYRIPLSAIVEGPEVRCTAHPHNMMSMLASASKYIDDNDGFTAILCRTNKSVDYVCKTLDELNIRYTRKDTKLDVNEAVSALFNTNTQLTWLSSELDNEEMAFWIKSTFNETNAESLLQRFITKYGESNKVKQKLQYLQDLQLKIEDLHISHYTEDQLKKYFAECPQCVVTDAAKLYVGTIHSAKGLEYDNVILPDVGSYSFKLNCEDNWNCYYVGITRAKRNLVIYKEK